MEHIVQFAIGIDDEAIVKRVTENAEREIIKNIQQQVTNRIFSAYWSNANADPKTDRLSTFSEQIFLKFLEENKEDLLDKAAKLLAERLAKTKKGKEILGNLEV